MAEFKKAAIMSEITPNSMKSVEVGFDRVLLCRISDDIYAVADECSHDYAPISDGRLKGHEVVCPRHGARFDITSGQATAPPAIAPIEKYEVKVEGNDIYVLLQK